MPYIALHTPHSTGTIISPDRYMMDHPDIYQFHHSGQRTGKGHLTFTNATNEVISQLNMSRSRDGLWFVRNPILIPPT